MIDFDVAGVEECRDIMKNAVKKYPDMAQAALEKAGRKFKSDAIKETHNAVNTKTGNLTKGYRLGRVEGFGSSMQIHFFAEGKKNPHFHLIEKGHKMITPKTRKKKLLTNGGKNVGIVPGRLMIDKVRKDYDEELPKIAAKELDKLLKESGLE